MNNAIYNAKNPYQGTQKKVLCVCSAGLLRSPTAALVLANEHKYNTRACGIDKGHALIPLSDQLLYWADEIVCMDREQVDRVSKEIESFNTNYSYIPDIKTPVYALNIPDRYERMNKELIEEISRRYYEVVECKDD